MAKKALLMILDGWGCGDHKKDDVIFNTPTPYWDSLLADYPHSQLQASGMSPSWAQEPVHRPALHHAECRILQHR